MAGPSRSAGQESADVLFLRPPCPGGTDQFTAPANLSAGFLRRGEGIRIADGRLSRRLGMAKVYRASNPTGSKTFGTTGKYATVPAAAQLLVPYGGSALHFSIEATRAGATGQLIYGQDGADGDPPFDVSLSSAGVLTAKVNWDGGGSASVSSGTLADGSTQHGLFVHDAVLGTVTLYLNAASVGTPVTGLSSKRPIQTATMAWLVAAKKTAAAVVSLPFAGKIDALTLFSLAGTRPASGDTTLLATLLAHSRHEWASPWMDYVLFNYDMNDAGAVMKDRSAYKNDATLTGTPTDGTEVAYATIPCNYVGGFDALDGSRVNVMVSAGRLFYQYVRSA